MADESLRAEFESARLAGDYATMERLGPQLYPEPGGAEGRNQAFLAEQLTRAFGPGPAPVPDPAALAETNTRAERLAQLETERDLPLNTEVRRQAIQAEIDDILRADHAALESHAPEPGPAPDTLMWAEGTPDPVKRAFCALGHELGVSRTETQAALTELSRATWPPAEQFHATMRQEWGAAYKDNLARVQRELDGLHGPLRDAIADRMADDVFSPEVARWLVKLPGLRARGGRG